MKKVAVIIKHPYRDNDFRVDIYDVPKDTDYWQIKKYVESKMIGPFNILAITEKVSETTLQTLKTEIDNWI